jgi:hypothetical protein
MTTPTHAEELLDSQNDGLPAPREAAEETEFEFEPTIVRGLE